MRGTIDSGQMVQAFFLMDALAVEAMRKAIRHRLVVEFIFHNFFACRNNSFQLLKQKVLLVETNGFPKGNSQFLLLKLLF